MNNSEQEIVKAVDALKNGQTILYPTDTIWGIGCNATDSQAVERIYSIKQRDRNKSMLVLCADLGMVRSVAGYIDEDIEELMLNERPTTVIVPACNGVLAANLPAADGTIGIRIPNNPFCQQLLRLFGKPIVSTSANISNHLSPTCYADIDEGLKKLVDFCLPSWMEDSGSTHRSSRIVKKMPDGTLTVLRP